MEQGDSNAMAIYTLLKAVTPMNYEEVLYMLVSYFPFIILIGFFVLPMIELLFYTTSSGL